MTTDKLVALAQWWLAARRTRYRHFSAALFDEMAWDMVLQLFVDRAAGLHPTVEDLARTVDGAGSVSTRWLQHLVHQGLVTEEEGRLSLTPLAEERMRACLAEVVPGIAELAALLPAR